MHLGKVLGTVVATQKTDTLRGQTLRVIQMCNEKRETVGEPLVVVDPMGARVGDFVMWVGKREASLAIPGAAMANSYPIDAAITGIIDDLG